MPRLCIDSAKDLLERDAIRAWWLERTRVASCEFGSSDQKQAQSDEDSSDRSRGGRTPWREAFEAHGSRNKSHGTQVHNPVGKQHRCKAGAAVDATALRFGLAFGTVPASASSARPHPGRLASIFSRPSIRMRSEESSNERNACLATELPNRTWVTNQCRIVKAMRPW